MESSTTTIHHPTSSSEKDLTIEKLDISSTTSENPPSSPSKPNSKENETETQEEKFEREVPDEAVSGEEGNEETSKLQKWNEPRINLYRYLGAIFSFFVMGMNDGAYGVSSSPFFY